MADGVEAIGNRRHFKYIVVGCGGIGSAAVYWLSRRAPGDVLGLEQFELGHHNGGSQDLSRGIRLSYHDDRYARLAPAAYDCWSEVERESGQRLLYKIGGLQLAVRGTGGHDVLEAYCKAMARYNIPFERLTSAQLRARFPQFTTGPEVDAFYQKDAGILAASLANSTHLQLAQARGAVIIDRCPVLRTRRDTTKTSNNLLVTTTKGTFSCERLVVCSGAWLNEVLGSIGVHVPVVVTQEQVTYMATPHLREFSKDRFPLWCFHTETNDVYAMPPFGNSGTKIGIDAAGPHVTGNTRNFTPDPARVKVCTDLLKKILPKFLGPEMYTKTCLYTMTLDRDFVVDTCARQGYSDVIVCCGGGHAFKFAGVLGKILAELAVDGATEHDISGFSMDRPAVTQPDFKPVFYMGSAPTAAKL